MVNYWLEKWFLSIQKKNKVFQALSYCYRAIVYVRHKLFDVRVLPVFHSKKKVVSIGNIVAGGTGKTPFTRLLAQHVGLPVAIVTRGFRAKRRGRTSQLVRSLEDGDEAWWLAQNCPLAQVIVGKNRRESARLAEALPIDYILLEDGMQHRYLYRDLEIVLLHCRDLFGGGAFLPRGLLRDSPKRLRHADYVVIHGARTEQEFIEAAMQVRSYTSAPLIGTVYIVLQGERFANKKVGAFCGIGKPEEFYSLLESLGCHIVERATLADHEPFYALDLFVERVKNKGGSMVICTEKDFVKLQGHPFVQPLRIEMEVRFGKDHFAALVRQIAGDLV